MVTLISAADVVALTSALQINGTLSYGGLRRKSCREQLQIQDKQGKLAALKTRKMVYSLCGLTTTSTAVKIGFWKSRGKLPLT